MNINLYSVLPFSQRKMGRKTNQSDGLHCAICGQKVKEPVQHWAVVTDGGARWGNKIDVEQGSQNHGFMGMFAIGPNCHKKYFESSFSMDEDLP